MITNCYQINLFNITYPICNSFAERRNKNLIKFPSFDFLFEIQIVQKHLIELN